MALEVNNEILLNDVVDNLTADNSIPKRYLQGNAFLGSTYADYYHSANIPNELIPTNWLERDSTTYKYPFEGNIFQAIDNIREQISDPSSILKFDDLSSIVANAFVPMSNIRVTEFEVALKSRITWNKTCNALLTDSAITGQYNIAENEHVVIKSANELIQYGNQSNNWQKVKNDLSIVNDYDPETVINGEASKGVVRLSTLNALINIALSATNHIRTTLSCYFQDEILQNPLSVIYHEKNTSPSGSTRLQKTYYKFSLSVLSYKEAFPNHENVELYCWATSSEQTAIPSDPYIPGTIRDFTSTTNLDLYPIFNAKIVYHIQGKISGIGQHEFTEYATLGTQYTVKNLTNVFSDVSFDSNHRFAGWSVSQTDPVITYVAGNKITLTKTTIINLWAVCEEKRISTVPRIQSFALRNQSGTSTASASVGQQFGKNSGSATTLETIVNQCQLLSVRPNGSPIAKNLPDIKYLTAICIKTKQKPSDSSADKNKRLKVYMILPNGTANELLNDRMGSTSSSTAKVLVFWNTAALNTAYSKEQFLNVGYGNEETGFTDETKTLINGNLTRNDIRNLKLYFTAEVSTANAGVINLGYVDLARSEVWTKTML